MSTWLGCSSTNHGDNGKNLPPNRGGINRAGARHHLPGFPRSSQSPWQILRMVCQRKFTIFALLQNSFTIFSKFFLILNQSKLHSILRKSCQVQDITSLFCLTSKFCNFDFATINYFGLIFFKGKFCLTIVMFLFWFLWRGFKETIKNCLFAGIFTMQRWVTRSKKVCKRRQKAHGMWDRILPKS